MAVQQVSQGGVVTGSDCAYEFFVIHLYLIYCTRSRLDHMIYQCAACDAGGSGLRIRRYIEVYAGVSLLPCSWGVVRMRKLGQVPTSA